MRVAPSRRRSRVGHSGRGLQITIPARRNVFLLLFLSAWLVAWGFGWMSAAREIFSGKTDTPGLFLGVWLVLWTIGGAAAICAWLWGLKGSEVILLAPGTLVVKRQVFGVGPVREYELTQTKNLRVVPSTTNPRGWGGGMQFWNMGGGAIAFDYGSKTVHIGSSVDEVEARQIVDELSAQHSFAEGAA